MIALYLFVLCSFLAQTLAAQEKDPSALSALQRAANAAGAAPGSLHTVEAAGFFVDLHFDAPSETPFWAAADAWGRVRWEMQTNDGVQTSVIDSALTPANSFAEDSRGRRLLAAPQYAGQGLEAMPVFALALWIAQPRHRIAPLEGTEAGTDRVLVAPLFPSDVRPEVAEEAEAALRQEVEVDAGGRIQRLTYFLHPDDGRVDIPVVLAFADYRRVQGVLWPHRVEVFSGARKVGEYVFAEVLFNRPLEESLFN
ncbi:MAG TPA: hypothetical protein VLU25_01065 [Acidobacteriota bacterium]|nr:hypothetical protein [Acidobacteriota bacterium]